jgi:hypothetical protein
LPLVNKFPPRTARPTGFHGVRHGGPASSVGVAGPDGELGPALAVAAALASLPSLSASLSVSLSVLASCGPSQIARGTLPAWDGVLLADRLTPCLPWPGSFSWSISPSFPSCSKLYCLPWISWGYPEGLGEDSLSFPNLFDGFREERSGDSAAGHVLAEHKEGT